MEAQLPALPLSPLSQTILDVEIPEDILQSIPEWEEIMQAGRKEAEPDGGSADQLVTVDVADLHKYYPGQGISAHSVLIPALVNHEAMTGAQLAESVSAGARWIPRASPETSGGAKTPADDEDKDSTWIPGECSASEDSEDSEKEAEPAQKDRDENELKIAKSKLSKCRVLVKRDKTLGRRPVPDLRKKLLRTLAAATIEAGRKQAPETSEDGKMKSAAKEPSIEPAVEYLSEGEAKSARPRNPPEVKRKRGNPTASSPKQGHLKKAKKGPEERCTVKVSVAKSLYKKSSRGTCFKVHVEELMFPGAEFKLPNQDDQGVGGLINVDFQFHIKPVWHRNHARYGKEKAICKVCAKCIRPRCGMCAGCHTTPGEAMKSSYDACLWTRCCFKNWKSGSDPKNQGTPTNDVIHLRKWINQVDTFCNREFSEEKKRAIRSRLQLYADVLCMNEEEERLFWSRDERAFDYIEFDFVGGDKFSHTYRDYEIARYEMHMQTRKIKIRRNLNPDSSMDLIKYQLDVNHRSVKTVVSCKKKSGPPARFVSTTTETTVERKVMKKSFRKPESSSEEDEDQGKQYAWTTNHFGTKLINYEAIRHLDLQGVGIRKDGGKLKNHWRNTPRRVIRGKIVKEKSEGSLTRVIEGKGMLGYINRLKGISRILGINNVRNNCWLYFQTKERETGEKGPALRGAGMGRRVPNPVKTNCVNKFAVED